MVSKPSSLVPPLQPIQNVPKARTQEGNTEVEEGTANLIPYPTNEPPSYPPKAREQGLVGKMVLQLTVDQTGYVIHVKITEGKDTPQVLQDAAISAIRGWRFRHKTIPREKAILSLPIVFNLVD